MKGILKITGAALLAACCVSAVSVSAGADSASSPLGVYRNSFGTAAEISDFDLYSSFGEGFREVNGTLYTARSGEQKAILKTGKFTDFSMEADIVIPTAGAYIDGGFYLGVNGAIGDGIDCINAYQVCILRSGGHSPLTEKFPDCTVKIYRFTYLNGVSDYEFIAEGTAPAEMNVSVKAEMKGKELSVYLSGNENPVLSYELEDYAGGKVGFRAFYCAMGFDNLRIYAENLQTQTAELNALIARAEETDASASTQKTQSVLSEALAEAKAAKESGNQYVIDEAFAALQDALNGLVQSRTYEELCSLMEQAEAFRETDYTQNSYRSLRSVLEKAKTLSQNCDEQELSVIYQRLSDCIGDLNAVFAATE